MPTGTLDNVLPLVDFGSLFAADRHGQLAALRLVFVDVHNTSQPSANILQGTVTLQSGFRLLQVSYFYSEMCCVLSWEKVSPCKVILLELIFFSNSSNNSPRVWSHRETEHFLLSEELCKQQRYCESETKMLTSVLYCLSSGNSAAFEWVLTNS